MKLKLLPFLVLPLLAGCLSGSRSSATYWVVEYAPSKEMVPPAKPKYESVRLTQFSVRPPYDGRSIAVLRANGSVAFDYLNEFAASPSSLAKSVALDALQRSGVFSLAVSPSSTARVEYSLEFSLRQFALDCRDEANPVAVAEVSVLLMKNGVVAAHGHAESRVPFVNCTLNAVFSQALSDALCSSLKTL